MAQIQHYSIYREGNMPDQAPIVRPIQYCYWVDAGNFLAGEYPRNLDEQSSREKMQALRHAGIEVFVDLTTVHDGLSPYDHLLDGARRVNFPIPDVSVPENDAQMKSILDEIDSHLCSNRKVYVHCWGGIGRTGVVVGCWLARHHGGGREGYARLQQLWLANPKSARRDSPETREQVDFILKWPAGQ